MRDSGACDLTHDPDGVALVGRGTRTRAALLQLIRPAFATMASLDGAELHDRNLPPDGRRRRFWWRWGGPYAAILVGFPLVAWAVAIAGAAFRGTLDADWPSIARYCGLIHLAGWTGALFFLPTGLRQYRTRVGSLTERALALRADADGLTTTRDGEPSLAGPWQALTLRTVGIGPVWFTPLRQWQVEEIVLADRQDRRERLSAFHLQGGQETLEHILRRLIRHERLRGLPLD